MAEVGVSKLCVEVWVVVWVDASDVFVVVETVWNDDCARDALRVWVGVFAGCFEALIAEGFETDANGHHSDSSRSLRVCGYVVLSTMM